MEYLLNRNDLMSREEYEQVRTTYIEDIAARKQHLRVDLEDIVAVFEMRESVVGALMEMLRSDTGIREDSLDEVLKATSVLVPSGDEIVCCLYARDLGSHPLHEIDSWFAVRVGSLDLHCTFSPLDADGDAPDMEGAVPVVCRIALPVNLRESWLAGPVTFCNTRSEVAVELTPEQRSSILATLGDVHTS